MLKWLEAGWWAIFARPNSGLKVKRCCSGRSLAFGWAIVEVESPSSLGLVGLEGVTSPGPSQVQLLDRALLVKACPSAWQGLNNWNNLEAKFFKLWEMEVMRKQQIEDHQTTTNRALVEEALRYGSVLNSWGKRASRSFPSFSLSFGRTPVGEYYDLSGALREEIQEKSPLLMITVDGAIVDGTVCWDMVEVNRDINKGRGLEWSSTQPEHQEVRGGKENRWEESSLAKFSHFLGFSTKGLEKEILEFLVKIRKRWERIHSKGLLEKSKFERELKRPECSINYEGGKKQKSPLQGRGCQLSKVK